MIETSAAHEKKGPVVADRPFIIQFAIVASYAADAMLPVPGPPGSGEYSGSPTLAAWYDYDATTHAVTP